MVTKNNSAIIYQWFAFSAHAIKNKIQRHFTTFYFAEYWKMQEIFCLRI